MTSQIEIKLFFNVKDISSLYELPNFKGAWSFNNPHPQEFGRIYNEKYIYRFFAMKDIEEEMKKFTEGFAYNAPQEKFDPEKHEVINHKYEWNAFDQKEPDGSSIWLVSNVVEDDISYHRMYDRNDLKYWKEEKFVWQYAYPPKLPQKEEHLTCKKIGSRITLMCRQDCNSLILSIFDSHNSTMLCEYVKFCPICGFSLGGEDET